MLFFSLCSGLKTSISQWIPTCPFNSSVSALSSSLFILCVRSWRLCSIKKISCPTFRTMQAFVKARGHFIRWLCVTSTVRSHFAWTRMVVNPLTLLCCSHWGTNRVMLLLQMLMVDSCRWALELKEHYLWCHLLMQTRVQVRFSHMELGLQVKLSWTREWNEQKKFSLASGEPVSLRLDAALHPEALNVLWGGSTPTVSISSAASAADDPV